MFADEASDSSIIIEIVAHDPAITDEGAVNFYFTDMAETNQVRVHQSTMFE